MKINPDGTADLTARFSAADAAEIDARVRALAVAEGLTLAEAHVALLRGHEGVQVHLNIYRAWDVPDSPAFLHRAGWLDQESTEALVERATHVRDMDEAAWMTTGAYRTPEALRAYLEGRDGDCRGPACTCPATAAQQDHRINHADGGPTSAENLASLCQRHHNLKTSGALFYVMDPHTGDIVWLLEDGTWFYDEPEGPLSRKSRRWLQTLARRREERHTRVRQAAQERRQMKERARRSHDDPPPF